MRSCGDCYCVITSYSIHYTKLYDAAFYSPDYNTRIYAYQPDVLYAFSAPAMFGEGQIVSSNIRWKTNSGLAIYLRTTYGMRDYNAEITPIREANILLRWSFGLSKKYVKPTIPF